ncbi:hypothetical protein ACFQ51_52390 [Streptomyces kaempferi]
MPRTSCPTTAATAATRPSSFTTALLTAMGTADPTNLDRLAAGFPDYVAAVTAIQYDPDGVARLQAIVQGEVAA